MWIIELSHAYIHQLSPPHIDIGIMIPPLRGDKQYSFLTILLSNYLTI